MGGGVVHCFIGKLENDKHLCREAKMTNRNNVFCNADTRAVRRTFWLAFCPDCCCDLLALVFLSVIAVCNTISIQACKRGLLYLCLN